jgi:hypothetical protein
MAGQLREPVNVGHFTIEGPENSGFIKGGRRHAKAGVDIKTTYASPYDREICRSKSF